MLVIAFPYKKIPHDSLEAPGRANGEGWSIPYEANMQPGLQNILQLAVLKCIHMLFSSIIFKITIRFGKLRKSLVFWFVSEACFAKHKLIYRLDNEQAFHMFNFPALLFHFTSCNSQQIGEEELQYDESSWEQIVWGSKPKPMMSTKMQWMAWQ